MKRTRRLSTLITTVILMCLAQVSMAQGNSQNAGNGNTCDNGNSNACSNGNGKGKAFGRSKNIGVGNASDGIKGRIITGKDIAYTGDPLEISLQFQRGAELVTSGAVDAYVVVFSPLPGDDDSGSDSDDDDSAENDDDSDSSSDSDDDSGNDSDDDSGRADALSDAVVLPVSSEASEQTRRLFAIGAVDVSVLPAGTYQLGLILTNPGGDPLNINDWYTGLLGLIDIVGLTVTDEAVPFDADGDGDLDDDIDDDGFSDDDDDDDEDDEDEDEDDNATSTSATTT